MGRFIKWIFSHKLLLFVYLPFLVVIVSSAYIGVIYVSWQGDKDAALKKLANYKKLIDRTEDLKKGYVYSYNEVDLSTKVVDIPTKIYDKNNQLIGEFFEQKREIVPYNYIPQWIVKGVVASEDRDFYNHHGISYSGIMRALATDIIHFRIVQGGSTITQQLAKVLFTDMERNLKRKIYEAFCATVIENHYDKQDILSMYLNLIYFGNGAYGVEATSKMFFGKSVRDLNEVESAVIVATISNPKIYSPLSNLKNSIRKTRRILKSLCDAGYMHQNRVDYQFKKFLKKWDVKFDKNHKAISSIIGSFVYSSYRVNRAPFFNEQIRRILNEKFGENVVKKGGLRVYTTIDADAQDVAVDSLKKGILAQRQYHLKRALKFRNQRLALKEKNKAENIQGAFVSVNPFTGEIFAYVGGYSFSSNNQVDNVVQTRRQPGSSIKPLVYATAIEERVITPATVIKDKKIVFKGGYSPKNYSHKYAGNIIAREALRKSVNIVAVKVLNKIKYKRLFEILQNTLNLDNKTFKKRFRKTLSFALGTYEIAPIENVRIHSLFVNGGQYIEPYGIRFVKDYNGTIVWNNEEDVLQRIRKKQRTLGNIIDPGAAAITISMLKNPHYWAIRSKHLKFQVAGKTGTSTNYNDAWFVGDTSNLVTAVWIGNKAGAISLGPGRAGGVVSAPVFADFISKIYRDNLPKDFSIPQDGLTTEKICLQSGMVANPDGSCPKVVDDQLFYSGTEPGEYCKIHSKKKNEKKDTKNEK